MPIRVSRNQSPLPHLAVASGGCIGLCSNHYHSVLGVAQDNSADTPAAALVAVQAALCNAAGMAAAAARLDSVQKPVHPVVADTGGAGHTVAALMVQHYIS